MAISWKIPGKMPRKYPGIFCDISERIPSENPNGNLGKMPTAITGEVSWKILEEFKEKISGGTPGENNERNPEHMNLSRCFRGDFLREFLYYFLTIFLKIIG